MVYITVKQSPIYHQMTLEEFLFQDFSGQKVINENTTNTRTYKCERASEHFTRTLDVNALIEKLTQYNQSIEHLLSEDRASLYHTFHIPKKSGGLRRIDAPLPELMDALRRLKTIFECDFFALYHTSAYAYIKGRCTIDAMKRHQANESKWFGKLDLHDFFGSTTLEYVMTMFSQLYPFSEVVKYQAGEYALKTALSLAFLNGGLPQGTPISPLITNLMMIPVDYALANTFRDFEKQRFVYTRYADDFTISSRFDFDIQKVSALIIETLNSFNAPFSLNESKTRYGSSSGRNWNLGVMLNKDNEITVGYKKKKQMQSMMFNYITDKKNGIAWPKEDIRVMQGLHSYYRMVEGETIDAIVKHLCQKVGMDILREIKDDLK